LECDVILNVLNAIKYLLLGIIQGITEVLPISSSGHVEIFKRIMSVDFTDSIIFLILVNTGSLITFIIIYWKILLRLIKGFLVYIFKKSLRKTYEEEFFFMSKILIATIPAGLIGFLFEDTINRALLTHGLLLVSIGLLLTATVLFYITRFEPFRTKKDQIGWLDALLMGIGQSIALLPGVSRSGMTSSTALRRGRSIDTALNFSFIMYIPVSLGSTLLMFYDIIEGEATSFQSNDMFFYVLAFLGAMVATYIAYKLIFNIFRSGQLKYFSYYCFGASVFALLLYIV